MPEILDALSGVNLKGLPGYGTDEITLSAAARIREAFALPEAADVFFLSGGTQTNAVVISAMLRPCEGVLAADSAHIAVHEAGAIEATGHKVITLPSHLGLLDAADLEAWLRRFDEDANRDHTVQPGLVYVTFPTEYGTLYSLSQLEAIAEVCRRHSLPLYLDGARLPYALAAKQCDITPADISRLCDAFYIGGTKTGLLFGEAVVFTKGAPRGFFTHIKRAGALFAKGWVIAAQFDRFFRDDLWLKGARHALEMAIAMKGILRARGLDLIIETPTNQQFCRWPKATLPKLLERVAVGVWEEADSDHAVVRFTTDWSTTTQQLDELDAALASL